MKSKKNTKTTEYKSDTTAFAESDTEYSEIKNAEGTAQAADELEQDNQDVASSNPTPPNVVKLKSRWWLRYLITFLVLSVLTVLIAWWQGAFTETDQQQLISKLCDAFFVSGILGVSFGLIIVASNGGTFDMLAYGLRSFFRLFKKDPVDRKYGNFYEYRKAQQSKKRTFWYLVIVGGVFTLVGGALLGWYYAL